MNDHIAAKLPCNEQSQTPFQILIEQAPKMTTAELELVAELSRPGQICIYITQIFTQRTEITKALLKGEQLQTLQL